MVVAPTLTIAAGETYKPNPVYTAKTPGLPATFNYMLGKLGGAFTAGAKLVFTYPNYYSPNLGSGLRCKVGKANPPTLEAYCVSVKGSDFKFELVAPPTGINIASGSSLYITIMNVDAPAMLDTTTAGSIYVEFYAKRTDSTATSAVSMPDVKWNTAPNSWNNQVAMVTGITYDPA